MAAWSLVPLLLASCRSGGREPPTATLRVRNDLVPAATLTVSLLPATGARQTLGTVRASDSGELRIPIDAAGDPHRLLAESGAGPAITSRQFTLGTASVVEWNVGQNILNVAERR